MKLAANGHTFEVEDSGETDRPAVVLIMGLGMSLIAWPESLVESLRSAGWRVVRFDNRDAGLSDAAPGTGREPHLVWQALRSQLGLPVRSAYTLEDMARDTLGVMDALGIARAHIVGASMGGMIAQRVALLAPERTLSLTSIMSSTGARGLPRARPEVMKLMLVRPPKHDHEALVAHYLRLFALIGSPGFPVSPEERRLRADQMLRRAYRPEGTRRQLLAVLADGDRARRLGDIRVPTLVIHGEADPLLPLAHGLDTARRIPRAQWVSVPGMAHDFSPALCARLLQDMLPHFAGVPV